MRYVNVYIARPDDARALKIAKRGEPDSFVLDFPILSLAFTVLAIFLSLAVSWWWMIAVFLFGFMHVCNAAYIPKWQKRRLDRMVSSGRIVRVSSLVQAKIGEGAESAKYELPGDLMTLLVPYFDAVARLEELAAAYQDPLTSEQRQIQISMTMDVVVQERIFKHLRDTRDLEALRNREELARHDERLGQMLRREGD